MIGNVIIFSPPVMDECPATNQSTKYVGGDAGETLEIRSRER
jgi:hypothetical protein